MSAAISVSSGWPCCDFELNCLLLCCWRVKPFNYFFAAAATARTQNHMFANRIQFQYRYMHLANYRMGSTVQVGRDVTNVPFIQ